MQPHLLHCLYGTPTEAAAAVSLSARHTIAQVGPRLQARTVSFQVGTTCTPACRMMLLAICVPGRLSRQSITWHVSGQQLEVGRACSISASTALACMAR